MKRLTHPQYRFPFAAALLWAAVALVPVGPVSAETAGKDPKVLVDRVHAAVGGLDRLKALKDVEYTYVYRDNATGEEDISLERYVFEGELSWARYSKREKHALPAMAGEIVQGYDGNRTWVTRDGVLLENEQAVGTADFLRKTNYYWFAMMFKLLDPGISYAYEGSRQVGATAYDLVRIGFAEGVGDASDTYLLYINPQTGLVDRFLFTVMDFGMSEPLLMTVEYAEVEGLKLPAVRRYIQSNWAGEIVGEAWIDEIMSEIRFDNGFDVAAFAPPRG